MGQTNEYKLFKQHLGFVNWGESIALAKYGQQLEEKGVDPNMTLNQLIKRESEITSKNAEKVIASLASPLPERVKTLDQKAETIQSYTERAEGFKKLGFKERGKVPDLLSQGTTSFYVQEKLNIRDAKFGKAGVAETGSKITITETQKGADLFPSNGLVKNRIFGKLDTGGWVSLSYRNGIKSNVSVAEGAKEARQPASAEIDPRFREKYPQNKAHVLTSNIDGIRDDEVFEKGTIVTFGAIENDGENGIIVEILNQEERSLGWVRAQDLGRNFSDNLTASTPRPKIETGSSLEQQIRSYIEYFGIEKEFPEGQANFENDLSINVFNETGNIIQNTIEAQIIVFSKISRIGDQIRLRIHNMDGVEIGWVDAAKIKQILEKEK